MTDSESSNLERNVARLRAQTLMSWEQEARTLAWFGVQDGMSILMLWFMVCGEKPRPG